MSVRQTLKDFGKAVAVVAAAAGPAEYTAAGIGAYIAANFGRTVAATGLGVGTQFVTATEAKAADEFGTYYQFRVNNASISQWLSNPNAPDIILPHIEQYFADGKTWNEANIERAIKSVPLDAMGAPGVKLGQVITAIAIHRDYSGVCTNAATGRGGTYIPNPSEQGVIHGSILTGWRGTVRGLAANGRPQQNYRGTPGSEPQTAACDPRNYTI